MITPKMEITVTSVTARNSVGKNDFIGTLQPAEGGLYVCVEWEYKNISKEPLTVWSMPDNTNIVLQDPNGVKYSYDIATSGLFAGQVGVTGKILSNLNPGLKVTQAVVFEVAVEMLGENVQPGWKVLIDTDRDIS